MIVSRTPFRISLFGGGTDFPAHYHEHGGSVLGMAINKYCYISVRRLPAFFEYNYRVAYSRVENAKTIADIEHPAVRGVLSQAGIPEGLEIHNDADLPARSGLGSSSSFTVGLINALRAYQGRRASKRELALEAIRIEQEVIGESVGSQDQVWAAHGGLNRIDFHRDGEIAVQPLIVPPARLNHLLDRLMLFFTGFARTAATIEKQKLDNLPRISGQLRDLVGYVDEAEAILTGAGADMRDLARMLHESWLVKRSLAAGVSNGAIDDIYTAAMDAGALGGKVLGAGGGGFILFYVEPEHQPKVRERLAGLVEVDFTIDRHGSSIVIYEPDGLHTH